MIKTLLARFDQWLDRLGDGDYWTLDCKAGIHDACAVCSCDCHTKVAA